ncbi:MAG: NAD(P)H-dependent oxidoreductase subunit E [Myxococcota bacterium]
MNLIAALQTLQAEHGHLRDEDLRELAARTRVALYEIQAIASFYPHFRRQPPPAIEVSVCRDLSCAMHGGAAARTRLEALAAERDDAAVVPVSCLGRCDGAPACLVNGRPAAVDRAAEILDGRARSQDLPSSETPRPAPLECDPYRDGARGGAPYGVFRELAESDGFADVPERLLRAGLRGMGGAGFPTGRKWALVRDRPAGPRVVICNADESEPGTFKDRALLEWVPHLLIEGMAIAAASVGAEEGWIYLRHEFAPEREKLESALAEAREAGVVGAGAGPGGRAFDLRVFVSPGGYILGEETALLEALEGRRGEPRHKPPYPVEKGLHGRPTVINNVETLALVPHVLDTGRVDRKLFAVSGDVARPGVHEVPFGASARELIERCGGMRDGRALAAFLPGGASTGFLGAEHADTPLTFDALRAAGSALGSGAVVVIAEGRDLLEQARSLVAFFRNESCGKCVPCRVGTVKAVEVLEAARGRALSEAERDLLGDLDATLRDTSICGLGHVALTPAMSALRLAGRGGGRGQGRG